MVDGAGAIDGLGGVRRGAVAVPEQPGGVGGPRPGVDGRVAAGAERLLVRGPGAGELEVLLRRCRHAQRQGRAGEGEMGLAAESSQDGVAVGDRDRPGGQGMGRRDVAADEPRRPQADERIHQRVPQGESLGQGAGPLERPRELGVGVAAVGVERGRHRGQRADLQQVAVEAVRQLRELPERGLVQVDRLGVSEDAGGGLRGAVVVLECPGAVSGTGVLVGQLPRHLVGAAGVQELQRLRQSAVQEPARGRADLLVRRVAQQVVGEVVAAAGLVQDPQPPQLVDRADDRVGVEVRRLAEQLEVEGPADGGAQPGDVPGVVAELVEPRPEDGAQVGGRAVLRSRAGPVTGGLDDVQREPARRGHGHVGDLVRDVPTGQLPQELAGLLLAEGGQRDLPDRPGGAQPPDPLAVGTALAELGGPGREREHQRPGRLRIEDEGQEVERLLVAPLEVVEHEQQRSVGDPQRLRQALVEAVPLPRVDDATGGVRRRARIGSGDQALDLGPPHRGQRGDPGGEGRLGQPLGDRGEREPPRRAVAVGRRDHAVAPSGRAGRLGHEPGLADTRLADDQDGADRTRERLVHDGRERVQLLAPPDEPDGGHHGSVDRARPRGGGGDELGEQPPGLGVRLDAELLVQERGATVVGAHRRGAVAAAGMQPDQVTVAGLLQRGELHASAGRRERHGPAARAPPRVRHQGAQLHALDGEPVTLGDRPVVVQAGQQLAPERRQRGLAVLEDGLGVAGRHGQGTLARTPEVAQVDPAGVPIPPGQVAPRHQQRPVVVHGPPQLVQLAAQVRQRLLLGGVGPERGGDPGSRLGNAGVHGEIRDERERARRARPDLAGGFVGDRSFSQQGDPQHVTSLPGHRGPSGGALDAGERAFPANRVARDCQRTTEPAPRGS